MTNLAGVNLYMQEKLSVVDLKQLFPPVLYKNADQLSEHLTASLLLDKLEEVNGSFSGEMAFWLKLLSTPTRSDLQLQKVQFKRNVFKAYRMLVEPEIKLITKDSRKLKPVSVFPTAAVLSTRTADTPATTTTTTAPDASTTATVGLDDDVSDGDGGGSFTQDVPEDPMSGAKSEMINTETMSSVVATPLPARCNKTGKNSSSERSNERSNERRNERRNESSRCTLCGGLCGSQEILKDHMFTVHSDILKYKCPERECPYRSKMAVTMREHVVKFHSKVTTFKCELCAHTAQSKTSLTKHKYNVHLRKDHPNTEPRTVPGSITKSRKTPVSWCSECGQMFFSEHLAEKHCTTAHLPQTVATVVPTNATRPGDLKFKCSECNFTHSHKYLIDIHMESSHDGKALLVAEFIEHDESIPTIKLKCPQCEFTSPTSAGINCHVGSRHGRVIRRCELCDFKTFYKRSLNQHINITHRTAAQSPVEEQSKSVDSVTTESAKAVNDVTGWDSGIVAAAAAEADIPVEQDNSAMESDTANQTENMVVEPADQMVQIFLDPTNQKGEVTLKLSDQAGQMVIEQVVEGSEEANQQIAEPGAAQQPTEQIEIGEVPEEIVFIDQVVEETVITEEIE